MTYEFEHLAHENGFDVVCGIDEAGRGPLAGPVFAAAVILPEGLEDIGINDSKKLSEKKRDFLTLYAKKLFRTVSEQQAKRK